MTVNISDAKTQKIISILINDPRLTASALGNLVGLSRAKCSERIDQLLKGGYLQLRPSIDRARYQFYKVLAIKLKSTSADTIEPFERIILNCQNIVACYFVEGEYDYIAVLGAEIHEEFVRVFNKLQRIKFWDKSETSTIIRHVKNF